MSVRFNGLSYRLAQLMFAAGLVFSVAGENVRADDGVQIRQYVQLSVVGKYSAARGTITAAGKPKQVAAEFAIDFGKSPQLKDKATALDGKTVSVRGALVQCSKQEQKGAPKCDRERSRSGLFLQPVRIKEYELRSGKPSSKDHGVSVVCRGLIHTDVVALGGETTGATIELTSDGQQTWELELKDRELEVARKANGRPVVVSGALEVRNGIAIRERWIIVVRNLSAS
ncbi:MAG: hypothetical protein ACKVII_21910 [Planctomycetales bacterium]|jgi:hypothetical protein